MLNGNDSEKVKNRTPSGNLVNIVKERRNFFLSEIQQVEVKGLLNRSNKRALKTVSNSQLRLNKSVLKHLNKTHVADAVSKHKVQTSVNQRDVFVDNFHAVGLKIDMESDSETFVTPPSTPTISDQSSSRFFVPKVPYKMNVQESQPAVAGTIFSKVIQELENKMEQDGPHTMDVQTVHAMFKKLQTDFEKRLESNTTPKSAEQESDQKKVVDLKLEISKLSPTRKRYQVRFNICGTKWRKSRSVWIN